MVQGQQTSQAQRTRPVRPELWTGIGFVRPEEVGALARQLEADGWDGASVFDTQCLHADPFVMMTAAALATKQLKLSISTSNPATRHPAVAASAIVSVAAIAGDRIYLGIGRGDSALAYVGGAPASGALFERYVAAVRRYLHGEGVAFESIRDWRLTEDVSTIRLGHAPSESRLVWPGQALPPIPIAIHGTGSRALKVAGRWADRLVIAVGADPARVRWAIEVARAARLEAGLEPDTLSVSAVLVVGVAEDMNRARRSVASKVAAAARFAVMSGRVVGPVSDSQRRVYEQIRDAYDMTKHGGVGAQVDALTAEFIDSYAIVGSPARCVERMVELYALGVDAFGFGPPFGDVSENERRTAYRRLVDEVIPGVRAALG